MIKYNKELKVLKMRVCSLVKKKKEKRGERKKYLAVNLIYNYVMQKLNSSSQVLH